MEKIKIFVENLIGLTGLTGSVVPVTRHALLVVVAVMLAVLSDFLCRKILVPLIVKLTKKTDAAWDDVLFSRDVLTSACHIVPAVVIAWLLPMVFYELSLVELILERVTNIYIVVMTVKTLLKFIDALQALESDGRRSSMQQYFRSLCGVLRVVIVFLAAIVMVAIVLGKSPMTLIAGLGATSAVLMLVFKDTIEGLVAGIQLTSNDMLHKGDWITVDKAGANGIVEDISLNTVKVRNFDNTIITLSPKTLMSDSFQNWIGMQQGDGRRVKRLIYIDFRSIRLLNEQEKTTLAGQNFIEKKRQHGPLVNLTAFRSYVEEWLSKRNDVNAGMTLMVRQLEATNTGLPIEIYFFLRQKQWVDYEHHLAEIMEQIYAMAPTFHLVIYEQYPQQV